ncbi:MAG TPA: glycosyltransferase 87 family protein [Gaiellaceae bacterium]|nr:glycosyltransferase 87 family protein [Gaiellaceae bacterium]
MVPRQLTFSRVVRLASIVFCSLLPLFTLGVLFASAIQDDAVAFDFRVFYAAAEAVLRGETPYQPLGDPAAVVGRGYVYPPVTAIGAIPFTMLPLEAAGLLVMALLVVAALAVPLVLGVRDWRCYGVVLLWPPVISAIQTGSVTILLALGAALTWRFRDRLLTSSASAGVTLAVKLILWPMVVWLAATRRLAAAALSCLIGLVLVLAAWAAIGFSGLADYPDVLRRLQAEVELDSYTAYVVALDAGAPSSLARAIWLALGLGLLSAVVVVARRGGDQEAFVLAIAAALALTPIVWLHYFALLVVVVAVAQPRLGLAWFVPLAMFVTPGSGSPTPFETSATLAVAALTIAVALRASVAGVRPVGSDPPLTPGVRPHGSDPEPAR